MKRRPPDTQAGRGVVSHSETAIAARTALMNYRREHGLVENPKRGFYIATEKALALVEAQKGEGSAAGNSGPFGPQPTPLTTAAA